MHVLEYIWKAARALFGESCPEAEEWVGARLRALLTGSSGGDLARTIRWVGKESCRQSRRRGAKGHRQGVRLPQPTGHALA